MEGNPHIIGLTGSFGSGCTTIGRKILVPKGYSFLSLSDLLKQRFNAATGKDPDNVPRAELQNFGDEERRQKRFFSAEAIEKIKSEGDPKKKWVIDSIRNTQEVRHFRELSRNFFLFGIYADKEERWARVAKRYNNSRDEFNKDDLRDSGRETPPHGQKVQECFSEADVVFTNDEHYKAEESDAFKRLCDRVEKYARLVANPLARNQPTPVEKLMAMAYAAAQRSSCLQRKVGAVIADGLGSVISSGFNEVPVGDQPCSQEWGKCFRGHARAEFVKAMVEKFPALAGKDGELEKLFKEHFRILDICRSLHAEENAILNLARNGRSVPLTECTLYTTTYPCRLCANKIATMGFAKVVYVEPYPDEDAKVILEDVDTEFFEGITYRAYFRVYGEEHK